MKHSPYQIIKGAVADWQAIHALEKKCFAAVDVFKPSVLKHLLKSKTCEVYVLKMGQEIVGHVTGLFRHFRIPSGRVYKICVDPGFQGKGYAGLLLGFLEQRFRQTRMDKCCAEVRISNATSRLMFEKHGYVDGGVLTAYYPDGEDGLKLWKTL